MSDARKPKMKEAAEDAPLPEAGPLGPTAPGRKVAEPGSRAIFSARPK